MMASPLILTSDLSHLRSCGWPGGVIRHEDWRVLRVERQNFALEVRRAFQALQAVLILGHVLLPQESRKRPTAGGREPLFGMQP